VGGFCLTHLGIGGGVKGYTAVDRLVITRQNGSDPRRNKPSQLRPEKRVTQGGDVKKITARGWGEGRLKNDRVVPGVKGTTPVTE